MTSIENIVTMPFAALDFAHSFTHSLTHSFTH